MSRYFRFAARHPYLVAALVVVLFLPWVWMARFVPIWALLTSLALVPVCAFIALALVVRDVNSDDDTSHGSAGDEPFLKWRKRTRLFQQVVVGLDTMLERWDTAAQNSRKKLQMVNESVEEVIKVTENAVSEISKSFRVVVGKANEQTEAAMALLKRDARGSGILSLPEFIEAYDRQLANVTTHMGGFSQAADEMAAHQKRISEHAKVMEETIDGLRNMASQISRIALDGSVAMTSGTVNPRDFVEMTDRIRGISAEAHELTRKTRHGLDAITDEVRTANKRTTQVADATRRALEVARAEVTTLNAATIEQTRQIEAGLTRMNELSVEIQKDINQIIVAMQFQDITRQKLERVHKPALGATAESLGLLSHETQALLQRDLYRAVRAYAQSAMKMTGRDGVEKAARAVDETREAAGGEAPAEKKVELF